MKKTQILNGNKLISDILTRRKNKPKIKNLQLVKEYQEKIKLKQGKGHFSKNIENKKIAYTSNKTFSPIFNKDEDFDNECQKYYNLMRQYNFTDQKNMNNHLTNENKWDNFPLIRAINTHGTISGIKGITPKAYAKVCRLMEREISSGGRPLIDSKRY